MEAIKDTYSSQLNQPILHRNSQRVCRIVNFILLKESPDRPVRLHGCQVFALDARRVSNKIQNAPKWKGV